MLTKIFHWIVSVPVIYDFVQYISGGHKLIPNLSKYLSYADGSSLLDVGGGTGRVIPLLPKEKMYICLDNDFIKLQSLLKKFPGTNVVLADAANLPFCTGAITNTLIALVSHHLSNPLFSKTLKEAARVCDGKLIFLDGLKVPNRIFSNFLWRYDRGQFPRSDSELIAEIERNFIVQNVDYLSIFHKYMILLAEKRNSV